MYTMIVVDDEMEIRRGFCTYFPWQEIGFEIRADFKSAQEAEEYLKEHQTDVLVTDIFAAREKDPGDIHATMLVKAMQAEGVPAHYTPTFDDAEAYLRAHWQPGDLVITMSCGNINLLNAQIQKHGD